MLRRAIKRQQDQLDSEDGDNVKPKTVKKIPGKALGEVPSKNNQEKVLEKLVLGADEELIETLEKKSVEKKNRVRKSVDELAKPKPVWDDDDDNELSVIVRDHGPTTLARKAVMKKSFKKISGEQYKHKLKNDFEKVSGTPTWARLRWERTENVSEDDDSDTEDLLKTTGNYLAESDSLPQGVIQLKRCSDANKDHPSKSKVTSVQFHPTSQVLLTAGLDQTLNLFQVDGKTNAKIQSVFLEKFPIFSAQFSVDGKEVVMGSRHKSLYYYDMMVGKVVRVSNLLGFEDDFTKHFRVSPDGKIIAIRGKYGNVYLVSAASKELIHTLKMNGTVDALAFNNDGSRLFTVGDDGEVYVWDMDRRQCIHRFVDEGCIQGTSLAVSRNSQYIACGSHSGVVNVYDESCLQLSHPKPLKAVMNLTTPCTDLVFNPHSEILAMSSNYGEKAVKMVHLPSFTVFSNFPEMTDIVRTPHCMDFSTQSGYFTIGNHKGQALLYRVKHYGNY